MRVCIKRSDELVRTTDAKRLFGSYPNGFDI